MYDKSNWRKRIIPESYFKQRSQDRVRMKAKQKTTRPRFSQPSAKIIPRLSQNQWPLWIPGGLLFFTVLIVYGSVRHFVYLNYDDGDYVFDNPRVPLGLTWSNLGWAFLTTYACNWHPLTWLSHMVDCQLFGLDPGPAHLVNVLFHATNAVLVLYLLYAWTGCVWKSTGMAFIFGLHPVHLESVAWIAERKDVLSACFGLLSLWFYTAFVRAADEKIRSRSKQVCLLCLLLGLLSKPMLVTWPCLFLVLDIWVFQRIVPFDKKTLMWLGLEKIPFFLLSFGSCVATYVAQKSGGAVVPFDQITLLDRGLNAGWSYVRYLGLYLWPVDLIIPYGPAPSLPFWLSVLVLGGLIGLSVWALRSSKMPSLLRAGWFWYLGTLVPVIGLLQVGNQSIASRYLYLPSIGLGLILISGLSTLEKSLHLPKIIPLSLGVVVAMLLGWATSRQLPFWKDGETLFQHTLAIDPNNYDAVSTLAWIYASDLDPRIRNGSKALKISEILVRETKRKEPFILNTLAAAYAETGDYARARATAEEALARPEARNWGMFVELSKRHLEHYRQNRALRP